MPLGPKCEDHWVSVSRVERKGKTEMQVKTKIGWWWRVARMCKYENKERDKIDGPDKATYCLY